MEKRANGRPMGDPAPWVRTDYSAENCSMLHTLEVVGDKWALPIMREFFFGIRRFSELQSVLGCARNLLSARLRRLTERDLLELRTYKVAGHRARQEYILTHKGRELLPVLVALLQWGDRWEVDANGPPVLLTHRHCGAPVTAALVCSNGHQHIGSHEINLSAGPGAIFVDRSSKERRSDA